MNRKLWVFAAGLMALAGYTSDASAHDPVGGAIVGTAIGAAVGGPVGAAVGAVLGTAIASDHHRRDRYYSRPGRYQDNRYQPRFYDRGYDRGYSAPPVRYEPVPQRYYEPTPRYAPRVAYREARYEPLYYGAPGYYEEPRYYYDERRYYRR